MIVVITMYGIYLDSITNFIRQRCAGKRAKQAAKLTWTGKIIHLGDGFYVMVPINQPPGKQCRLKPFPGLRKGGTIDV